MSAKTKRALRKKRYLDNKDASQLYMKEYRDSNRNAIRESQKQYYEQHKDAKKLIVQQHCTIRWNGLYSPMESVSEAIGTGVAVSITRSVKSNFLVYLYMLQSINECPTIVRGGVEGRIKDQLT